MELSARETTRDGWEPVLKVLQVRTQRQSRLAELFSDYGPFEGRKPLIPGYMFVSLDQWPLADGILGYVGLVAVKELAAFADAIRADRARKQQRGMLAAYIHDGAIEMFGRRLVLRGSGLVEQH